MSINKKQKAYEYMKSRIIEGFYAPGQRIVINQLVKELSTSAIPIREAVRQLEAEGLIKYKDNIGPVVTPINEGEYIDTLAVLAVMEGYATALSYDSFPEEKLVNLTEMNEKMTEAIDDLDLQEFGRLNREFHNLIYSNCPNKYLANEIRNTWRKLDSIRRTGSTLHPKRVKESIQEHRQLIELLSGDAGFETVESAARTHKLNTLEAYKNQKGNIGGNVYLGGY